MQQNYHIHLKRIFSWSNYYENIDDIHETIKNIEFSSESESLNPNKGNSYVYNCYFYEMHSQTNGGAIVFSLKGKNILIEKCTFYNSSANNQGAICITGGISILAFLCSSHCFSDENDGFGSINTDDTRTINSIFDSSISHCEAINDYILAHQYGYISVRSVNLSHNKANERSALYCGPNLINQETKHGSNIIYCSFSNNTAETQNCVLVSNHYGTSDITHEIKNCNIIENNSTKTILCKGNTDIILSCILNNSSPCFYTDSPDSFITLYFCCVDNMKETGEGSLTSSGSITTFILGLTFISTDSCYSSFDPIQTKHHNRLSYYLISLHGSLFFISFILSRPFL